MTRVRLDQLSARARAQVVAALAEPPRRQRGSRGTVAGGRWRCATCGAVSTAWARAERHADAEQHRRIECDLDEAS